MSRAQRLQRVIRGERITADAVNRTIDKVNSLSTPQLQTLPAGFESLRLQFLQIADINPANTYIRCVYLGSSLDPFQVNLPLIYIETSRNFGGTIGNVTYVYTNRNEREATGVGGTETQYLTPPFVIGDVIIAAPVEELWFMIPDGRMWAIDPP